MAFLSTAFIGEASAAVVGSCAAAATAVGKFKSAFIESCAAVARSCAAVIRSWEAAATAVG